MEDKLEKLQEENAYLSKQLEAARLSEERLGQSVADKEAKRFAQDLKKETKFMDRENKMRQEYKTDIEEFGSRQQDARGI